MLNYSTKWSAMLVALALIAGGTQTAVAEKPFAAKKVVLQISDPNPFKQTLVLNVASNIIKEYGVDNVDVEIVAFGPGLRLLFDDNANSGRIQGLAASDVKFYACSNTMNNMGKKLGYKPVLNKNAVSEGPGVVRIVKLVTEDGYTLVKP
jgi:intracellular sulfur oxidation DsrE/DsrF family protein